MKICMFAILFDCFFLIAFQTMHKIPKKNEEEEDEVVFKENPLNDVLTRAFLSFLFVSQNIFLELFLFTLVLCNRIPEH